MIFCPGTTHRKALINILSKVTSYLAVTFFVINGALAQESRLASWQLCLQEAYSLANHDKGNEAIIALHKAFEQVHGLNPSGNKNPVKALLVETAKIYKKIGMENASNTVNELLLKPAYSEDQDEYTKAKLLKKRKLALLMAGDRAKETKNYLLADLLYSSLLPGPGVYNAIATRGQTQSEYQEKVVDRLVRLYLDHGDYDRAERLIESSKRLVLFTKATEIDESITEKRLLMLEIDLALVKLHKGEYKQSIKLFDKNTIKLERLMQRNKSQLATIYNDFALVCSRAGKNSKAKRNYLKALSLAKQPPPVSKKTLSTIESNYNKFLNSR